MSYDWTDDEFGWKEVRQELARIRRRVRARWLITLTISLALAAIVMGMQTRREQTFKATVMLRVIEGGFDPESAPPTSAQLQDYFWEVAMSRRRLTEIMERFDLYPGLRFVDPLLALDEMRAVLDVRVLRNYFQIERDPDAPPRSARVALSYSHPDPEKAITVARALADLIAEQEAKTRRQVTEFALETMSMSASQLERALTNARVEEARIVRDMAVTSPETAAGLAVRLIGVRKHIASLRDQSLAASGAVKVLGLRSLAEGEELGLSIEVIDPGRIPPVQISSTLRMVVLGVLTFVLSLPITGTAVAAYDLRVYDAEDLKRLGLLPFGLVPAFPGYRRATLHERLRRSGGAS